MCIVRGIYDPLPSHFSSRLQKLVDACLQRQQQARPSAADILADRFFHEPSQPGCVAPSAMGLMTAAHPSTDTKPAGRYSAAAAALPTIAEPAAQVVSVAEPSHPPVRIRSSGRMSAQPPSANGGRGADRASLAGNRMRGSAARRSAAGAGLSAARKGVHDARRREEERKAEEARRRVAEMIALHDRRVAEQV